MYQDDIIMDEDLDVEFYRQRTNAIIVAVVDDYTSDEFPLPPIKSHLTEWEKYPARERVFVKLIHVKRYSLFLDAVHSFFVTTSIPINWPLPNRALTRLHSDCRPQQKASDYG